MYRILEGIVTAVAPVIPFTAEEIYESLPGKREDSVHLAEFVRTGSVTEASAASEAWERIFQLREAVSKVLEKARAAGTIGQSLEADIVLSGVTRETVTTGVEVDLANIFIVSHVDFEQSVEPGEAVTIEGLGSVSIRMLPARGSKCGRCWRFDETVTGDGGLCSRCRSVVDSLEHAAGAMAGSSASPEGEG